MESSSSPGELSSYSQELFDAVMTAVPQWITSRMSSLDPHGVVNVSQVVADTVQFVREQLRKLLSTDVDDQRENPLHVLRQSSKYATSALRDAGISPVHRDEFDQKSMPDDVYALGPLTWRDLSDSVHDAGITWGAWKAATVLSRRRAEGKLS